MFVKNCTSFVSRNIIIPCPSFSKDEKINLIYHGSLYASICTAQARPFSPMDHCSICYNFEDNQCITFISAHRKAIKI